MIGIEIDDEQADAIMLQVIKRDREWIVQDLLVEDALHPQDVALYTRLVEAYDLIITQFVVQSVMKEDLK